MQALGIKQGITMQALPMAAVLATRAQVEQLAARSDVRSLWPNTELQYENNTGTAITGVQRLRNDQTLTDRNGGSPYSGNGVAVMVNDSGIDALHGDLPFGTKVVQNVEGLTNLNGVVGIGPVTFIENVPNTDLGSGHGTHVAGIVAGTGAQSNGKYAGVATGASLVGYGSGVVLLLLDVLTAFDYAVDNRDAHNIRAINNSWGNTGDVGTEFDPDDPINVASKIANDAGIAVVFSTGNSGPADGTITGNFKKAPWVIAVANAEKSSVLAPSSSRGVRNKGGTVIIDGKTFTWEDRPTVTAPGTNIISTRSSSNTTTFISSDGPLQDAETIEPELLPFYTSLSGTSMAAPHGAGIVALMFEANPSLTPAQVKQILQQTATNMPGYEPFEVGTGMVNAYAAVDRAAVARNYGTTLNLNRTFHANVTLNETQEIFNIAYNTVPELSPTRNQHPLTVPSGLAQLDVRIRAAGVLEETGNTLNLVLIAPDGAEFTSGVNVLFPLQFTRAVLVDNPMPGDWTIELRGLRGAAANPTAGVALPEDVSGTITFKAPGTTTGLNDIAGHPDEASILVAVKERLVDGFSDKKFRPSERLERGQLADYLNMGVAVRQFLPTDGSATFADVSGTLVPFAEAVAARGAVLKDRFHEFRGVMLPTAAGQFSPRDAVRRADLAYSLVQALGLEGAALALNGQQVTVQHGDQRIPVEDASQIPAGLEGYVQLALDLNIMQAAITTDSSGTPHATFSPLKVVTRGQYAVTVTRFFAAFLDPNF
jgi:serine protease AprX